MSRRSVSTARLGAALLLALLASATLPGGSAAIATDFTLTPLRACTGSTATFTLSFLWTGDRRLARIYFYSTFLDIRVGELEETLYILPGRNNVTFKATIPWDTVPGKYVVRIRVEVYSNPQEEKPLYTVTKFFIVYVIRPPPPRIQLLSPTLTPYTTAVKLRLYNAGPCGVTCTITEIDAGRTPIYRGNTSVYVPPGGVADATIPLNHTPPLGTNTLRIGIRESPHPGGGSAEYNVVLPVNFTGPGIVLENKSAAVPAETLHLTLLVKNTFPAPLTMRVVSARLDPLGRDTLVGEGGTLSLDEGGEGVLDMVLNLSGVEAGNYTLTIVVEASPIGLEHAGPAAVPLILRLSVLPPPRLEVEPDALRVGLGERREALITLVNPTGFQLTIASVSLNSTGIVVITGGHTRLGQNRLAPGESVSVTVSMEGLREGEGELQVAILYSDPYRAVHAQKATIRVSVTKNLLGFMGDPALAAAALLVAVAATVVVARRLKALLDEAGEDLPVELPPLRL